MRIYLACDKGNKKGIGHFVKILAWYNATKRVVETQTLDIDAAGGSSIECAKAIRASMNKLKENDNDNIHLLYGQATDSGGGGTLENFHDELDKCGLCCSRDEYLVANCTTHALQIQLKNAVEAAFGHGALEKINVSQMLHSVYRLQESLDLEEWRHMLFLASEFVLNYDAQEETMGNEETNDDTTANDETTATATSSAADTPSATATSNKRKCKKKKVNAAIGNRQAFCEKYNKVLGFHSTFKREAVDPDATKFKDTILLKMLQPILTRWWTVGSAASHTFNYYLQLYVACQMVINIYKSNSNPFNIATDLFSLLSNQDNFVNLCLIRTFHKEYLNKHLAWLQEATDLSGHVGFQSHNIATRYFLMDFDMVHIASCGEATKDYHEAVAKWNTDDAVATAAGRTKHLDKLLIFLNAAHASLHKHFSRWLSPKLLPMALLSEAPATRVVANIILGKPKPTVAEYGNTATYNVLSGKLHVKSIAHGCDVELHLFDRFIRKRLEVGIVTTADNDDEVPIASKDYSAQAKHAAELVCQGFDMRDQDYTAGTHNVDVRLSMHKANLALPSQTQFVETGVKEAKNVSSTDRSEQQRTCLAVIRSATPMGKDKEDGNKKKIIGIIGSAINRVSPHISWKQQDANGYKDRFDKVKSSLTDNHFRKARVQSKKAKVDGNVSKFKKQSVNQESKPQTKMPVVTGLIPYGKLLKARNYKDLKVELMFRGVKEEDVPVSITKHKDLLKTLEGKRMVMEGMHPDDAFKLKTFKKQSRAPFSLLA